MQQLTPNVNFIKDLALETHVSFKKQLRVIQDSNTRFREMLQDFNAFFNEMEKLDCCFEFSFHTGWITITKSGTAEELNKIWGELRRNGFTPDSRPDPKEVTNTVTVFFSHPEERYARIFLYFTSTVCHRVKVGTKTVQQDVYELQCGNLLPAGGLA